MRSLEMARDYLYRARRCLREADLALRDGDAPGVVRRSQEALELAAKALLRALGIEYPRVHDVSDVLLEQSDRMPEEVRRRIREIAELVSELAAVRGPAFYGYEREGIPPSEAFKMDYALKVHRRVVEYVELIQKALSEHLEL